MNFARDFFILCVIMRARFFFFLLLLQNLWRSISICLAITDLRTSFSNKRLWRCITQWIIWDILQSCDFKSKSGFYQFDLSRSGIWNKRKNKAEIPFVHILTKRIFFQWFLKLELSHQSEQCRSQCCVQCQYWNRIRSNWIEEKSKGFLNRIWYL